MSSSRFCLPDYSSSHQLDVFQMIVKYDQFVQDLKERKILQDMEFELFDQHGQKHKYRWPYLLSDGSILNFVSCTQHSSFRVSNSHHRLSDSFHFFSTPLPQAGTTAGCVCSLRCVLCMHPRLSWCTPRCSRVCAKYVFLPCFRRFDIRFRPLILNSTVCFRMSNAPSGF